MDDSIVAKKVDKSVLPPISEKAVIELRIKGLTCEEIGQHFGVTRQAISKRLRSAFRALDKDEIAAYKKNRVGFLEDLEVAILLELGNPDKLKSASANNLAYAFGQLHTTRRLEAGESTANFSLAATVALASELRKKKNSPALSSQDAPCPTSMPEEHRAQPA